MISDVNKKLNLKVSDDIINRTLPYLNIRHSFVHQNGIVDNKFKLKYPYLNYKGNKIELTQEIIAYRVQKRTLER